MKRLLALLAIVSSGMSFASELDAVVDLVQATVLDSTVGAQMIDWKVGDEMNYRLSSSMFRGTVKKEVFEVTEETLWLRQKSVVQFFGQTQEDLMETELERATGKVLRMIHNGEEQEVPDDSGDIEIIEQTYTEVEVPAGKFDSVYLKLNTKDVKNLELWVNPRDTVMDGSLKMIAPAQMTVTLELTSFKKGE